MSHEFLTAALAARRPGDVVLSEEGADNPARLGARRVWIVDPLDGTREFGEPGRTDWAVHVALWERASADRRAHRGRGRAPARTALSTLEPPAPRRRERRGRTPVSHRAAGEAASRQRREAPAGVRPPRLRIVVSRSRPPRFVRNISGLIDAELVPLGSAGAKVAAVICGEVDAYVHGGGFYEWDTAAPVAVARAAGLHASRIDGSALAYNQADLLMPDILVCGPRSRASCCKRSGKLPMRPDYQMSQLDVLEAEAIHVMREVAAEFERPALLFSGGKDSIVMLALAEKAFWPARSRSR